jgi:hypothetical protein
VEDHRVKLIGRRTTIQLLGVGLTAGGFLGAAACKQDKGGAGGGGSETPTPAQAPTAAPTPTAALDCNTPIEPASKTTRAIMQYKNPAAIPEKHCSACSQFIEAKYGACGGCKLFTGPVDPKGGCLSFAPKAADGVPAPAKSG